MNAYDWGLVNRKYVTIKEKQPDLMAEMKEDLEFYSKRIYQATKDLTKNEFDETQQSIKEAYINYAQLLIDYFKLEDIKEIMSGQLETIQEECEECEVQEPVVTKQILIHRETPAIIRIEDCFNITKTTSPDVVKPKRRYPAPTNIIDIRQARFREKGVKKRRDNKVLQATT
jgi:hypothetical protein